MRYCRNWAQWKSGSFCFRGCSGGTCFRAADGQLTNFSTRASVQTGPGVTIAGFIVTGTDSKTVVLRGLGPTLTGSCHLMSLEYWPIQPCNSSMVVGTRLWFNDNWKDTQQAQIQATGLAPPNDLESAILQVLQPGNYTAILSGKNGTTGVGLVEVYDISPGVFAELTNVSTRGFVGTGQSVMIGGFITSGGNGSTADGGARTWANPRRTAIWRLRRSGRPGSDFGGRERQWS